MTRSFHSRAAFGVLCLGAGLCAAPAHAQAISGTEIDVGAGVTTDYRYRGISRSDNDPALQAWVGLEHPTGLYVGAWGSTLGGTDFDEFELVPTGFGDVEIDLFAGYAIDLAPGTELDLGAVYQTFQGEGIEDDYLEPRARLSFDIGPVRLRGTASYALGRAGGEDSLYVGADALAGIPLTPFTVTASVGRSDSSSIAGQAYTDWSLGADYVMGPVTLGARYVDTDLDETGFEAFDRLAEPTVTFGASIDF